jgi:hypothetical protein
MMRLDFPSIAIPCERRQFLSGRAADYSLMRSRRLSGGKFKLEPP